jgi:hypothetical protein
MTDLFTTIIKKFSNYNDPAGVASASPGTKTVKACLDQTDPQRKSQILPQFATQIQQIINIMGIIGMGGSGGSSSPSQQQSNNISNTANVVSANLYSNSTSNAFAIPVANTDISDSIIGITNMVSEVMQVGLSNALAIESRKRGLHKTMGVMASVLNNPQYFTLMSDDYQFIIINALSRFEDSLYKYDLPFFPILEVPEIIVGDVIPFPIVTMIPDFYRQVFHHYNVDPYPGYIQYQNIVNFTDYIYIIRTIDNPPFSDASDSFVYTAQQSFVTDLDPYIIQANLSISALTSVMTDVLNKVLANWHTVTLGSGSQNQVLTVNSTSTSSGSSSSSTNLVAMLLPWLNSMIQTSQSKHLPKSVLNQGAIQQLLNKHGDMCAKMKMCQQLGQQAIQKGAGGSGPKSDF